MAGNAVALKFADLESLPASPTSSTTFRPNGRADACTGEYVNESARDGLPKPTVNPHSNVTTREFTPATCFAVREESGRTNRENADMGVAHSKDRNLQPDSILSGENDQRRDHQLESITSNNRGNTDPTDYPASPVSIRKSP
jgi:hypothetical protein